MSRSQGSTFPRRLPIPDPMVLIFGILVLAALSTHLVPAGRFERMEVDGRTHVIADSYHPVASAPASPFDVFLAVPKGLQAAAPYLFIVFIAGGLFHVLTCTGALAQLVNNGVERVGLARRGVIVWCTTYIYGLFGIAIGFENNISLVPIALLVAQRLGAPPLLGACMAVGGIGVGFALSPINPYTVGVSQKLADLPMFSGAGLRTLLVLLALAAVARFATTLLPDPSQQATAQPTPGPQDEPESPSMPQVQPLRPVDYLVLATFAAGLTSILYGVFALGWYIDEIAATFLATTIAIGLVTRTPADRLVAQMMTGASAVTPGALVIGLAASIKVLLDDAQVIDTLINALAHTLAGLPAGLAAILMTVVQGVLNFFVPSGSGQALITMPILIPLGDLLGISRQTTVLAFQIGDGLTNLIVPTSGGTLAMLAMAKVSYTQWLRLCFPLVAALYLLSWWFVLAAVLLNWQ